MVEYIFGFPSVITVDRARCIALHGGYCPDPNTIYLYGYDNTDNPSSIIYEHIITHEHLHAILHKFSIPTEQHEQIIRMMTWWIG